MAWRLVLCLAGYFSVLIFLAIYVIASLNSVRLYTPVAHADELQIESLDIVPALLGAMDAERRAFLKNADPRDQALYAQLRTNLQSNLDTLNAPLVLPSPAEKQRRELIGKWLAEVGDVSLATPKGKNARPPDLNNASKDLLDQINQASAKVREEMQAQVAELQAQEAKETARHANFVWILVGLVTFFTIILQLLLANSIIAPIRNLIAVVKRLHGGDLSARARINTGDEIQSLGESFNAMAENIVRTQRELREKNQRLSDQQDALRNVNAVLEERVLLKTRELEDKNQKLNEAARLKDEFLATLSHEFRTPLTPIITCAHLLSTDLKLSPEDLKNVQVIDRNARALSRMIDELLDLSTVTNRKLRLIRERTEMNEWARTTLEGVRPNWEKKQLTVNFIPHDEPVELEIDPMRLAQVLTNLMTNAIKYTDPKGTITVRLTSRKDGVRLAVTDSGTGLGRQEIERIFEMFHQSRTPHTQNVGGLGVGLTVARSLAELHGGGLLAESAGVGKGSTFTLWLPQLRDTKAVDFSVPSLTPLPDKVDRRLLRGRRILIVEDSDDTREALDRIFQRRSCQVTTATSAEEALDLLKREPPEIIISDIGLPGMSGLEFMKKVRQHPEWREVVAVALSGLGREKDIKGAEEAGFDSHLLQPVYMSVLDRTLAEALQKRIDANSL